MFGRQGGELSWPAVKERVVVDEERTDPRLNKRGKGRLKLGFGVGLHHNKFLPEQFRR